MKEMGPRVTEIDVKKLLRNRMLVGTDPESGMLRFKNGWGNGRRKTGRRGTGLKSRVNLA